MRPRASALLVALLGIVAIAVVIDVNLHPMAPAPTPPSATPPRPANATAPSGPVFAEWHDSDFGLRYGTVPTCSNCHYNPGMTFWTTAWHPARTMGANMTAWNLTVASSIPQTTLLTVQAAPDGASFVQSSQRTTQSPWMVGQTWSQTFPVKAGGTGLYLEVDAAPADNGTTGLTSQILRLDVKAPDGSTTVADGPRGDRQIIVVARPPVPGTWTLEATLESATVQGQAVPAANGAAVIEVQQGATAGPVVPNLIASLGGPYGVFHGGPSANLTFAAQPDGSPPNLDLRVWAYTDHRRFYQAADADVASITSHLLVHPGPEPGPPTFSAADLNTLWKDSKEYELQELDNALVQAFYTTNATGAINPPTPLGSPFVYPHDGPLGLLPGATTFRFELAWTPPVALPDVAVHFQPANRPNWFEAQNTGRGTGTATYAIDVDPSWWDPIGDYHGGWDMAAYLPLHPNTTYATEVQYTLKMYADR